MKRKLYDIRKFIIWTVVIIAINVFANLKFFRIDLTEDQRYSISESTVQLLDTLQERLIVQVYLDGELTGNYQHLQKTVEETLDEMKAYAGSHLAIEFVDPFSLEDSIRDETLKKLQAYGLKVRTQQSFQEAGMEQKAVVPGALVQLGSKVISINFLKDGRNGMEENFDQSISEVEYEFASAIKVLTQERKKRIAFVDGHGEAPSQLLDRMFYELANYYQVGRIDLASVPEVEGVEALVIVKPRSAYSDLDKYKLDQFVMNGGRLLFFVDAIESRKDSLGEGIMGLPFELGLDNLLRQYGVRIGENQIQDLQAATMPVQVENGQMKLMPWNFHPLLETFSDHIITKGLNPVLAKNLGIIDTVKAEGLKKTPLIMSSKYTRLKGAPVTYSPDEIRFNTDPSYYPQSYLPVAYILEGRVNSLYENRPLPLGASSKPKINQCDGARIFVCADGDIILNEFDPKSGRVSPMGLNTFTGDTYANKRFAMNLFNYMLDEQGVVNLRSKEVKIRDLDVFAIDDDSEQIKWQVINIVLPVLLILGFGILRHFIRKGRYEKRVS